MERKDEPCGVASCFGQASLVTQALNGVSEGGVLGSPIDPGYTQCTYMIMRSYVLFVTFRIHFGSSDVRLQKTNIYRVLSW